MDVINNVEGQGQKTLSIINLIKDGGLGGQIIISILFLLLAVSLYIYFERFFAIKEASKEDSTFMDDISNHILKGELKEAKDLCETKDNPSARLVGKGISRIGKPLEDIDKAIENAGKLEVYDLEENVSIIATIAGVAPMIGFLGTVIGMIVAIHEIANSGGAIDIKMLSDGLYTAMTTTVGGLLVGIVAYVSYNHLVVKTNKVIHQMEVRSVEFLDLLNKPSK